MGEIGAVGSGRHFTMAEEEALRHDASTSTIVKRDTKVETELSGADPRLRSVKKEQQEVVGATGAAHIGHAALEGLELMHGLPAVAQKAATIAGPFVVAGLAIHQLIEAHANAEEQNAAITKEHERMALISALKLPVAYQACRLNITFKDVSADFQSVSFRMAERLRADHDGLLQLQLHCDRGMNAARDCLCAGMSPAAFFKAHPRAAEAYAKDAAFHEGFDAYVQSKDALPPADMDVIDRDLDQRNGWYAQSRVTVRA
jgi:hypothetical protein